MGFQEFVTLKDDFDLMEAPNCPQCGSPLVLRKGPHGEFYGCSSYSRGCRGSMSKVKGDLADQQKIPPTSSPQTARSVAQAGTTGQNVSSNSFILATSISLAGVKPGDPVVVSRIGQDYQYKTRTGASGLIKGVEVGRMIKSLRDPSGRAIQGSNEKELFDKFDQVNSGDSKNVAPEPTKQPVGKKDRPSPEDVRLPAKHMSQYNKAIEETFLNGKEDIMIDALAGTGKTTMLKHLSSFIKPGEKWLYIVFNKKNQVESQMEFPVLTENGAATASVDVMTTHAFLGDLLKKNGKNVGGETQLPPRGQKWKKIQKTADEMIRSDWPESDHSWYNSRLGEYQSPFHWKAKYLAVRIAEFAKAYALKPGDPKLAEQMKGLIVKQGLDMDLSTMKFNQDRDYTDDIVENAVELFNRSMPGATSRGPGSDYAQYRDQDDTLWFASVFADELRWNTGGYNVVLMDEVQDFNQCQVIMAKKLRESGARVIAVGDKNQAMYGFRGSDSEAFDNLKSSFGGDKSFSLPINFRSGGNIIEWVSRNTHVSEIQAADHNEGKGEVHAEGGTHPPVTYENFMGDVAGEFQSNGALTQPTAIISRANAPLASTALQFLKDGVDFEIIGKDLSSGIIKVIDKITKRKGYDFPIEEFSYDVNSFVEELQEKWGRKVSKSDELAEIAEYAEVITSVVDYLKEKGYSVDTPKGVLKVKDANDLAQYFKIKLKGLDVEGNMKDAMEYRTKDPRKFVSLTTAHKSKGLEFDRVFMMAPGAYDPQGKKIKTPAQAQQERNAFYVAATRAKNVLMLEDEPQATDQE